MNSKELAYNIRVNAVKMTNLGKSSHIGSVLSLADILAVLYSDILKIDHRNPKWIDRDRFILSKGHAGAGVYAVLACSGFFSIEILKTHYQNGSILSGHVSHKDIPGVEFSTGSLGHGLSVACGISYAAKLDCKKFITYVILSEGDCDEGSNWEAMLFAGHHKLQNLTAIVDYNKVQSITTTEETLNLEPFSDKWKSFGWDVYSIDGHDHEALLYTFKLISTNLSGKPSCIIANTIKGKGVSFMENQILWHYRSPQGEEYVNALKELEEKYA